MNVTQHRARANNRLFLDGNGRHRPAALGRIIHVSNKETPTSILELAHNGPSVRIYVGHVGQSVLAEYLYGTLREWVTDQRIKESRTDVPPTH